MYFNFCIVIHRSLRRPIDRKLNKLHVSYAVVILGILKIYTLQQSPRSKILMIVYIFCICPYLYIAGSSLQVQSPFECSPAKGRVGGSIPFDPPVGSEGAQK